MIEVLIALISLLAGAAVAWVFAGRQHREEVERQRAEAIRLERELAAATTALEESRRRLEEQSGFVQEARKQLEDAFGHLAHKALAQNTELFLRQAGQRMDAARSEANQELDRRKDAIEQLLKPLKDNLGKLEVQTRELENKREKAYGGLSEQLRFLGQATKELQSSSQSLATALRGSSQARGRWGEMALRNIVELAGMTKHCDFAEQKAESSGARPDMTVHLPGGGLIPVDAKVPLAAYLDAQSASDPEERAKLLQRHAQDLRAHVQALATRRYDELLNGRIDFTILFLPAEPFLAAAFDTLPQLQDDALRQKILITTPVTLVALLRTVGLYWRQESIAENAEKVWAAANRLYERATVFQAHLGKVGKGLETAVKGYNQAVASYQSRLLPAGRELDQLEVGKEGRKQLEDMDALELPRAGPVDSSSEADPVSRLDPASRNEDREQEQA